MDNLFVEDLAAIKELNLQMETIKKKIEALETPIQQYMLDNNIEEFVSGPYKVSYKDVTTNRFDTTGFKAEHMDLYESFLKSSTSKRFLIK